LKLYQLIHAILSIQMNLLQGVAFKGTANATQSVFIKNPDLTEMSRNERCLQIVELSSEIRDQFPHLVDTILDKKYRINGSFYPRVCSLNNLDESMINELFGSHFPGRAISIFVLRILDNVIEAMVVEFTPRLIIL